MRNIRWTDEQTNVLRDMRASGRSFDEIALAVHRSRHSVKERWRWMNFSEYKKQYRRETLNQPRNNHGLTADRVSAAVKISDGAIEDRNRRSLLVPRNLTAAFFGDPLPGYSALERRA